MLSCQSWLAAIEDFMFGYFIIDVADNKLTVGALHKLAQGNWKNLEAIDISNNWAM